MSVGLVHGLRVHGLEDVATVERVEPECAEVVDVVIDVVPD